MPWTASPLSQFFVFYIPLKFPGQDNFIALTSVGIYGFLSISIVSVFGIWASLHRISAKHSTLYQILADSVKSFIGFSASAFYCFILATCFLIGITNLLGNSPFGYTVATSLIFSLGGSVTLWVWLVILSGTLYHLFFFCQFIPAGTPGVLSPVLAPIELVSFSARSVSLGVRLFSNVLAGHTLLAILSGFLEGGFNKGGLALIAATAALIPFSLIILLEIAVSLIQSYVFAVLLVSYIEGAL